MVKRTRQRQRPSTCSKERDDIIRAASGGFLFGIPLLYTMEVWWIGSQTSPRVMLGILVISFVVVFLLNRVEGFRQTPREDFLDTLMDSVVTLAIAIICATVILVLLHEIQLGTPLNEALGKLILESVPFSLGGALAHAVLSGDRWSSSNDQNSHNHAVPTYQRNQPTADGTLADIGATLIGAMIIAFNIAPTDEVPMLTASASPPWLFAIIIASLLISYGIVFEAGFTTQEKRRQQQGLFQRPLSETVISYLVSLFATVLMLLFFQKLSFSDPWTMWLSYSIVLGLPATIGGAAGRLAI
ncbi:MULTISPECIES: TIGR02587 family membrane protein [unclassified Coleofasciculus]|uniref:TIGR02587 family membrane protein n=1 Tax=unclassified Coleofasciculus TaxID=2692782 RepID=UPI001882B835|nr:MULTISPECIES: TIGR02587 family membrane protein [unclassified Coleofasciculus]MBE9129087.1 TIGR02587 family membrane protein [Coleofasciculus sp. LEGE 07081]MBE9151760.1 TIGR02587 family membrane protein [Coleofasciculus sp. LEGE 07092]